MLVYSSLFMAMGTIDKPNPGAAPVTGLTPRGECNGDDRLPPYQTGSNLAVKFSGYSENGYHGRYDTDATFPAPFSNAAITSADEAPLVADQPFRYLHDASDDHRLFAAGEPTTEVILDLADALVNDFQPRSDHEETQS